MVSSVKKKIFKAVIFYLSFLVLAYPSEGIAQPDPLSQFKQPILMNAQENLNRLIQDEDTDGDKKITIDDIRIQKSERGNKRFWLEATNGKRYELVGTYYLSNLLQELKLAQDIRGGATQINTHRIFENPVQRISRSIREIFWNNLTRRIDKQSLDQILNDEKTTTNGFRYIYVPHTDKQAYNYFAKIAEQEPDLQIKVERLPANITPEYVKGLDGKHGLLNLALEQTSEGINAGVPFVVPGGRFNEMYGWDSYFEALGLLEDGRVDLAKAMVDNFVYQITYYGKILNANRTYYLTRSQPPFITSMALAVYEHLPKNAESKTWLKKAILASIKEYNEVWMDENHLTETGLSRYYGSGLGPPPEVEPGHFDPIYRPYAVKRNMDIRTFDSLYKEGKISTPELDKFFVHDRCVRESGHDTTYRWNWKGNDICADFVTVDLNALLYKIELDIARTIKKEFGGSLKFADGSLEKSSKWSGFAKKRKKLMMKYLWDEKQGMFFDYNFEKGRRHKYISTTTFYPLWALHKEDYSTWLLTGKQAEKLVAKALPFLEVHGGVAASAEKSRGPLSESRPQRQWDYPNGWAPHQILIWQGLRNYGFDDIANRLVYRWLYTITRNAVDYNGTIPEKFDVVNRSHAVFAEYGNVGTKFDYITKEGFGWMNASYQIGLKLLPSDLRVNLEQLVPPEWIFE